MVTVSNGLASKPVVTIFSSLTSKLLATVSPGLASKPEVGFLVEPQNQGGGWFLGLGLKTGSLCVLRFIGWWRQVEDAIKLMEGGRRRTRVEI
jgi:hypothetical protein